MRPPGASNCMPRVAIRNCIDCKLNACPGFHFFHRSGFFLSVPSPEHGTSQRIRSKERFPSFGEKKCVTENFDDDDEYLHLFLNSVDSMHHD